MIVIGLTGSIGMGKTTVASQLVEFGAKICNADDIVHRLLAKDGAAVTEVGKYFPSVVKNAAVDRKALGDIVFHDKEKMKRLEAILHPLVVAEENAFIERMRRDNVKIAVLEIPLLFETEAEKRCDVVIVASAPIFIQKRRVMQRPHMTLKKFHRIIKSQLPDKKKRSRAHFVVQTGLGKAYSRYQVKKILRKLNVA